MEPRARMKTTLPSPFFSTPVRAHICTYTRGVNKDKTLSFDFCRRNELMESKLLFFIFPCPFLSRRGSCNSDNNCKNEEIIVQLQFHLSPIFIHVLSKIIV